MKRKPLFRFIAVMLSISPASAVAEPMELGLFQEKALTSTERCIGARDTDFCNGELQYALANQLITQEAYDWGTSHRYYAVISRNNTIEAICACGCFEENTRILLTVAEESVPRYVKIKDLKAEDLAWALDTESTLHDLRLRGLPISRITHGPENLALYVFQLANDHVLKLTQHHGTVLDDGRVIAAKDVKPGDSFIDADSGDSVEVLAINRETTAHDVYNFNVEGNSNLNHIVVAEGVLVGEIAWQNSLASELGQIQIRQ
jgi:hypothetical protein